ncbi:MAG: hypothetical protein KF768_09350 [Phycisphaeraceae bacterium]|nr:hypothetical protein [Phycisphaeraceae bacterium]
MTPCESKPDRAHHRPEGHLPKSPWAAGASLLCLLTAVAVLCAACGRGPSPQAGGSAGSENSTPAPPQPTNRVDIPPTVRKNLGITFAKAEYRNVSQTLRVPGRFEWLPTAHREYRAPLPGRVELLVEQFQRVQPGTPLYRLDSAAWLDLEERIAATRARLDSMGPLREAHRRHEESLADKVALWRERLGQLEALREAGGGSAAQFTEASAALNQTRAELADVMEKDADLEAQEKQAGAEWRALVARREALLRAAGIVEHDRAEFGEGLKVRSVAEGVVESIALTPGGLADEHALVLTAVRPDRLRFRAKALQSDLGRLRDGQPAVIVSASGWEALAGSDTRGAMPGALRLGVQADADERTLDLIVEPERLLPWARAGVWAQLEVTLAGGASPDDEELAIPLSAVVRDGVTPIIFRRDPADPDKAIRVEADLGVSDGRWIVIKSGVREGDEIVVGGNYPLMLATSGSTPKGGHFHPDGTYHEGDH